MNSGKSALLKPPPAVTRVKGFGIIFIIGA